MDLGLQGKVALVTASSQGMGRATALSLARYVFTGRRRPASVLAGHDLDRFVVRCDQPVPLQVDGEDLGDVTEAVFERLVPAP